MPGKKCWIHHLLCARDMLLIPINVLVTFIKPGIILVTLCAWSVLSPVRLTEILWSGNSEYFHISNVKTKAYRRKAAVFLSPNGLSELKGHWMSSRSTFYLKWLLQHSWKEVAIGTRSLLDSLFCLGIALAIRKCFFTETLNRFLCNFHSLAW